jgi:probable rRNA maturation factor
LLITNDLEIKDLNSEFRNKDKPTDVLSFPENDSPRTAKKSEYLGDIIISIETARKQAKEYGVSLTEECTRLTTHGLLHLLGYDHEGVTKQEATLMRRKEKQLLTTINLIN